MLSHRSNAGQAPAPESSLMQEADRHSRRLGKILIDASNASWIHDELMREVRLAFGEAKRGALVRLAALIASYNAVPVDSPVPTSRFQRGMSAIGRTFVSGAVAGMVIFGLELAAKPYAANAPIVIGESWDAPSIDHEQLVQFLAKVEAVTRGLAGQSRDCTLNFTVKNPCLLPVKQPAAAFDR